MIDLTSTAALELWNLFSRPNHSGFKEQIMFKRSSKHSVLVSSSAEAESTWISNHFISCPYTWWEYDGVSASWKPKVFPNPRLSPVASAPSMGTSPGKHWCFHRWGPPFQSKHAKTRDVYNPVNDGIFTISTGAGFLPSTVFPPKGLISFALINPHPNHPSPQLEQSSHQKKQNR